MDYNKYELLQILSERMSQKAETLSTSADDARTASIEAPGAMMSRYDSSKEEQGYLADALNLRSVDYKKGVKGIDFLELPVNPKYAALGCIARIDDGFTDDFFILPYGGGEIIEAENREVTIITPESPLASSLIGLQVNDIGKYAVNNKTVEYTLVDLM